MNTRFSSQFAEHIEGMLELRDAMGMAKSGLLFPLQSFDRFCARECPEATKLTLEIATAWCNEGKSSMGGGYKKHSIRQFGKYLASMDIDAFVYPAEWIPKTKRVLPYIFTDEELSLFFSACDAVAPSHVRSLRDYIVPVIFRLIYGCGLRPQEGRLLKRRHLDLEKGTLLVENSKRNKDRRIAVDWDLVELCRKYDVIADQFIPDREYFFPTIHDTPYKTAWPTLQFHRCCVTAGNIAPSSVPYDLSYPNKNKIQTFLLKAC